MQVLHLLFLAFFLFGHTAIWVAVRNRAHGLPLRRWRKKLIDYPQIVATAALPIWLAWTFATDTQGFFDPQNFWRGWVAGYAALCGLYGTWVVAQWGLRRVTRQALTQLAANHTERADVAARLGTDLATNFNARLFAKIPFNRPFVLSVHEKQLQLPRLHESLNGLSIAHLSDLHLYGNVAQAFFEYVVDRANEFDADFVAVTGDILEKERCFPWLPATLGRLRARYGVYFVLGNHDKLLPNPELLRQQLVSLGLIDLGREIRTISIQGQSILLAGNELPWFGPPPALPADTKQFALRILLSHSPDQINWARQRGFDFMLAGHTHGGQIRFPVIGPVVCPSLYGVKYAGGVFYEEPTLMQVSRGISGEEPLRINCPPELTKVVLKAGECANPQ